MGDLIRRLRDRYLKHSQELRDDAADRIEQLQAKVEEMTKPVEDAEEGEFTSCAEMLDDWFGSCNVQGHAEMVSVECEELTEEMRRIEKRYDQEVADLQAKVEELEAELDKMWKLVDYSGLSVDEAMTVLAQMKENDDG